MDVWIEGHDAPLGLLARWEDLGLCGEVLDRRSASLWPSQRVLTVLLGPDRPSCLALDMKRLSVV